MKVNCNIVRDLLPLYLDGILSDESKYLVEEHLKECPDCITVKDNMSEEFTVKHSKKDLLPKNPFQKIKRSVLKRIIITVIITFILSAMSVTLFLSYKLSGWHGIDNVLGINPDKILSSEKNKSLIKSMIAKKENLKENEIEFITEIYLSGYELENPPEYEYRFDFVCKIKYDNEERICVIYAKETFIATFEIMDYEFAEYNNDTEEWEYKNGEISKLLYE